MSSTRTILSDIWGNEVEVSKSYVSHRNRLIDVHLIQTFQVKGKRLLINTFKQNTAVPTMCIFFEDKESAQQAYDVLKRVWYPQPHQLSTMGALAFFLSAFLPPLFLVFLALFASLDRKN